MMRALGVRELGTFVRGTRYRPVLAGLRWGLLLAGIVAAPEASVAQGPACQREVVLRQGFDAFNPITSGQGCVVDMQAQHRLCTPEGLSIIRQSSRVVMQFNATGGFNVTPSGKDCLDIRSSLHSLDHRQLPLVMQWFCTPAHMRIEVELVYCADPPPPPS